MGNITPQTPPSFRCRCKKLKPHELLRGKLCLPAVSQGSAREKGKEENKCIKKNMPAARLRLPAICIHILRLPRDALPSSRKVRKRKTPNVGPKALGLVRRASILQPGPHAATTREKYSVQQAEGLWD